MSDEARQLDPKAIQDLKASIAEDLIRGISSALGKPGPITPTGEMRMVGYDCRGKAFTCGEYECQGTVGCSGEFGCTGKFKGFR